jgi:hypothetical protein
MPKINVNSRSLLSNSGSQALTAKRKRLQMIKSKQQKPLREVYDDEASSSSLNELRLVRELVPLSFK